jgi:hypothetical protein
MSIIPAIICALVLAGLFLALNETRTPRRTTWIQPKPAPLHDTTGRLLAGYSASLAKLKAAEKEFRKLQRT